MTANAVLDCIFCEDKPVGWAGGGLDLPLAHTFGALIAAKMTGPGATGQHGRPASNKPFVRYQRRGQRWPPRFTGGNHAERSHAWRGHARCIGADACGRQSRALDDEAHAAAPQKLPAPAPSQSHASKNVDGILAGMYASHVSGAKIRAA